MHSHTDLLFKEWKQSAKPGCWIGVMAINCAEINMQLNSLDLMQWIAHHFQLLLNPSIMQSKQPQISGPCFTERGREKDVDALSFDVFGFSGFQPTDYHVCFPPNSKEIQETVVVLLLTEDR
ncbi:hypothetical protein Ancab_013547 [Ancistrocladus abbreviatus]